MRDKSEQKFKDKVRELTVRKHNLDAEAGISRPPAYPLEKMIRPIPRVAVGPQPWAGVRNPLGIERQFN